MPLSIAWLDGASALLLQHTLRGASKVMVLTLHNIRMFKQHSTQRIGAEGQTSTRLAALSGCKDQLVHVADEFPGPDTNENDQYLVYLLHLKVCCNNTSMHTIPTWALDRAVALGHDVR
jgi:hypothetical protein